MSHVSRPVPTVVKVCDLCLEEIPESESPLDRGSLIAGYLGHQVTPRTKWAWLIWPPRDRPGRRRSWEEADAERKASRQYDFHGKCITELVVAKAAEATAEVTP